jgi:hypothetical protein
MLSIIPRQEQTAAATPAAEWYSPADLLLYRHYGYTGCLVQ